MGRYKSLGSLNSFFWYSYTPQLSGLVSCVFYVLSFTPELRSSSWTSAVIVVDCDIALFTDMAGSDHLSSLWQVKFHLSENVFICSVLVKYFCPDITFQFKTIFLFLLKEFRCMNVRLLITCVLPTSMCCSKRHVRLLMLCMTFMCLFNPFILLPSVWIFPSDIFSLCLLLLSLCPVSESTNWNKTSRRYKSMRLLLLKLRLVSSSTSGVLARERKALNHIYFYTEPVLLFT